MACCANSPRIARGRKVLLSLLHSCASKCPVRLTNAWHISYKAQRQSSYLQCLGLFHYPMSPSVRDSGCGSFSPGQTTLRRALLLGQECLAWWADPRQDHNPTHAVSWVPLYKASHLWLLRSYNVGNIVFCQCLYSFFNEMNKIVFFIVNQAVDRKEENLISLSWWKH